MPLTVITAAYIAAFAYYLQATIIVEPFWDMYSHVLRYLQFREDGAWWAYLWAPHVQHRHVWMRLLTAFDVEAFSGVAYPFVAAAAACLLLTAWLVWREVRAIAPRELRVGVGCLVVMLVLTSVAAVDCAIPINGVYPQALLFTVLTLVLFDGAGESGAADERRRHWRRTAAMLAAVAAAFANAAALALWPILVWTAWRLRAGRAWIFGLAASAVVFIGLYVYGLPLVPPQGIDVGSGAGFLTGDRLLRIADYLVTYLGLPWTRAAALSIPGRLVGASLLVAGTWSVVRHGFIRPPGGRLERLAVGLIMFYIASALLAAIGRNDVDPDVIVPVRYSVFVAPLHIGLLWLACPFLVRQWTLPDRRPLLQTLMVGAGVLLLVQQVAAGQAAVARTDAMRTTIRRFIAGETDPAMNRVIFDNLEQARQSWDTIRAAGVYTGR